MTISTTILSAYDVCKMLSDPQTCKQKALESSPSVITAFLTSYDACLGVSSPESCRRLFAYDIPTPPIIPFLIGIGFGILIKKI